MTDSRRKGKRTELELVAVLRPFFPEARRNLDQCREQDGRDILGTLGLCLQLRSWPHNLVVHLTPPQTDTAQPPTKSGSWALPRALPRTER